MQKLVEKSARVYRLPTIKKINYYITDSSAGVICPSLPNLPFDSIFNFKVYRYILPNISKYESYVICDTTFLDYRVTFGECSEHLMRIHGYLLLYDTLIKEAKVIALYYLDNPGGRRRTFDIDKNYVIHLQDYGFSFEKDEPEEIPTFSYTIKVLPNGNIEIKKALTKNK
jgi:hypothetical protein